MLFNVRSSRLAYLHY